MELTGHPHMSMLQTFFNHPHFLPISYQSRNCTMQGSRQWIPITEAEMEISTSITQTQRWYCQHTRTRDQEGFGSSSTTQNPVRVPLYLPYIQLLIYGTSVLVISIKEVPTTSWKMSYDLIQLHRQLATPAPWGNRRGRVIVVLFHVLRSLVIAFTATLRVPFPLLLLVVTCTLWYS